MRIRICQSPGRFTASAARAPDAHTHNWPSEDRDTSTVGRDAETIVSEQSHGACPRLSQSPFIISDSVLRYGARAEAVPNRYLSLSSSLLQVFKPQVVDSNITYGMSTLQCKIEGILVRVPTCKLVSGPRDCCGSSLSHGRARVLLAPPVVRPFAIEVRCLRWLQNTLSDMATVRDVDTWASEYVGGASLYCGTFSRTGHTRANY